VQYESFLLRIWRGSRHDRPQWSARLEGLQDGQHLQFGSADALLAHLQALLAADPPGGPDPPACTSTIPSEVDESRTDR